MRQILNSYNLITTVSLFSLNIHSQKDELRHILLTYNNSYIYCTKNSHDIRLRPTLHTYDTYVTDIITVKMIYAKIINTILSNK